MTLEELLREAYTWGDANATPILLGAALFPVAGTVAARLGKAGKTDSDGRFIASAVMAVALLGVIAELSCIFFARAALGLSPLDANAQLIAAPILCLAGCVVGLRLVFPLSELGSVRTALDLAGFLLACALLVWLASRFRWGLYFFGSFAQLVVVLLLAAAVLHRLYRRAVGPPS